MDRRPPIRGEAPRAEPEIIPPGAPDGRRDDASRLRMEFGRMGHGARDRRWVYAGRPGAGVLVLALLTLALLGAAALVLFLGFVLIWLPVAGVLLAALILGKKLRRYFGSQVPMRR